MSVPLAVPEVAGVLALLLRTTLLMAAAWAAAAALRKAGASAAARHMAWFLGLAALLALPLLWWLVPALRLPILPAEAAAAASSPVMAQPPLILGGPIPSGAPIEAGWSLVLPMIYALGLAALLLRLVIGRRMLRRLWSESGAVWDPAWETLLSQLSSGMGLSRRVELRISRGPAVPMTWGTLAPKLLLPAEAFEWPLERRRLVLLHELAHVARYDSFSRSLASLACALYWFHPGAWFAARRMRLEQEHAADDRVLMAGGSPQTYALSLLDLARGAAARPRFDQAAAMAGMYQLERRLVSITSPARRDRPGTLFLSSSALLAGCTTLLVAAGVPVSATPGRPGPFQAERAGGMSPAENDPVTRLAGNPSASARPGESLSSEPGGDGNMLERFGRESSHASPPSTDEPGSQARAVAGRAPASRGETDPGPRERADARQEGSRDGRQSPADAQPLSDYGWELQRRDSRLQLETRTASSPPTRLVLPAPPSSSVPRQRGGRPRWARNVPRLVRSAKPTSSTVSTSQGPLVLSWSIGAPGE